jgi:hypothetical protein
MCDPVFGDQPSRAAPTIVTPLIRARQATREVRQPKHSLLVTIGLDADVGHHGLRSISPYRFFPAMTCAATGRLSPPRRHRLRLQREPLGGQTATSGAPVQSSAPPTATDVVNQIQRGQTPSASLSKAGGTAPDTQLTPEVLANMSEDDFERLYEELSRSGNKEKLMQIFGH